MNEKQSLEIQEEVKKEIRQYIDDEGISPNIAIEAALGHLIQAGELFKVAGMGATSDSILIFATEAFKALTSNNNIDEEKLSDKKYDDILADIFKA